MTAHRCHFEILLTFLVKSKMLKVLERAGKIYASRSQERREEAQCKLLPWGCVNTSLLLPPAATPPSLHPFLYTPSTHSPSCLYHSFILPSLTLHPSYIFFHHLFILLAHSLYTHSSILSTPSLHSPTILIVHSFNPPSFLPHSLFSSFILSLRLLHFPYALYTYTTHTLHNLPTCKTQRRPDKVDVPERKHVKKNERTVKKVRKADI